ncbi:MAG: hypothetical protein AAGG72_07855, partial [Pseudomonadota bacterium]
MTTHFDTQKARASAWFLQLRDDIVAAFENLEDSHDTGPLADAPAGRFDVTDTKRKADDGGDAGGGLMSVMRGGRVFEKVGVNVSTVFGTRSHVRRAHSSHRPPARRPGWPCRSASAAQGN